MNEIKEFKWPGHRALILARRKMSQEYPEIARDIMLGNYDKTIGVQDLANYFLEKMNDSTE
jgi:hypothetical protein